MAPVPSHQPASTPGTGSTCLTWSDGTRWPPPLPPPSPHTATHSHQHWDSHCPQLAIITFTGNVFQESLLTHNTVKPNKVFLRTPNPLFASQKFCSLGQTGSESLESSEVLITERGGVGGSRGQRGGGGTSSNY